MPYHPSNATCRDSLGVVMAAVVAPGTSSFKPALQPSSTSRLLTQKEANRAPFTKTLSGSADLPDDGMAFSKTWTGSTRAPDEFDQGQLLIDADGDDDRSPWASDINSFGDLSFSSEAHAECCENQVQLNPAVSKDFLPSEGSKLHSTGECKPCTWFWKAGGCQNGRECMHCHLCPKSEVKLRKKDKLRTKKAAAAASGGQVEEPSMCQKPQLTGDMDVMPRFVQLSAVPFRPPPGLPHPPPAVSMLVPPPGLGFPSGEPGVTEQGLLQSDDESTTDGLSQHADQSIISDSSELDALSLQVPSSDDLCSVGSRLHASGECKPCSWFWKPQGCKNGKDCLHCHVCPEGEVRRKKKAKAAETRKLNSTQSADAEPTGIEQAVDEGANVLQLQALMVQQQLLIQQQQHQLLHMQLQMGIQQRQMQLACLPVL
eukprot:TRINITY_DN613_c0_g1_i3.p1 TRINITY_DN613_c0_g1~~TRINITY_DN613_c0_g1_i3.p1  ORF type:complete len:429 (+),score=78.94 TRINITY_DN613_c0_g1_i3:30-1316(+)